MLVRELSFKKFYVSELTYKGQTFYSLWDPARDNNGFEERLKTDKQTVVEFSGESPEVVEAVFEELTDAKLKGTDQTKCQLKLIDLGMMRAITHVKINAN